MATTSELPAELATPIFRRLFEQYREQPRSATVQRLSELPSPETYLNEIIPTGRPVIYRDPIIAVATWREAVERLTQQAGTEIIQVRQPRFATLAGVIIITSALMVNYWYSRVAFASRWGVSTDHG